MDAPDAPTLTETTHPDSDAPGVEVYFPTLDPDAVTITVYRIADGVREPIRGGERAAVAGDFVGHDWEVPFGVEAVYVGEIFDIGGASISGSQATITVDSDDIWMQDQVDPSVAFQIYLTPTGREGLLSGSFGRIVRQRRKATQFVFGKHRPFIQNFGLDGATGIPFDSYTESEPSMKTMLDLLERSPLTVRTPPVFASLPRVLSVDVPAPEYKPVAQSIGGFRHQWLLRLDEVEPVARAIIRPLVTWADWEAAFPSVDYTWAEVALIYAAGTWTDAVRNPPSA
jgi:hypothetical protein